MVFLRTLSRTVKIGTLWTKPFYRKNSTKVTYAQKMYQHEFSLENYDCIGFDLDHTICRYKLKPLFDLIYKTLATYLVEKYHYPDYLIKVTDEEMSFAQKGIILDKKRGNFLKLDHQYKIVTARHGTKLLSHEDIAKIYGSELIWEESRNIPQKLTTKSALHEPYYVYKDYFVTAGSVLCAKIVDILDKQNGGKLHEYSFWDHFLDGLYHIYERNNFKNNSGKFFPSLKQNPDLYLDPCSENVKKFLQYVSDNKVTYLLTSSNYDSAAFLAEYALGKDWRKYFNIIITFACKPSFFWNDNPFCIVDENNEVGGIKPKDMKAHLIYSQGNWKDLQQVCAILTKVPNPKSLYFGDSLIEDVYAASEIAQCDTVAIVEEMSAEGMDGISELHPESEVLLSDFWGSFFGNKEKDESNLSFWANMLSQNSKLAIPNLDYISGIQINEKITSFGPDSPIAGYFPGVPKILIPS